MAYRPKSPGRRPCRPPSPARAGPLTSRSSGYSYIPGQTDFIERAVRSQQWSTGSPDLDAVQSAAEAYSQALPEPGLEPVEQATVLALFSDLRTEVIKAVRKEFALVRQHMDERFKPIFDNAYATSKRLQSVEETLENLKALGAQSVEGIDDSRQRVKEIEAGVMELRSDLPPVREDMKDFSLFMKDLHSKFSSVTRDTLEPTASVMKTLEGDVKLVRDDVPTVKSNVKTLLNSVKELISLFGTVVNTTLEPTAATVKAMEAELRPLCTDVPDTKKGIQAVATQLHQVESSLHAAVNGALEPTAACVRRMEEGLSLLCTDVPTVKLDVKALASSVHGVKAAQDEKFCSISDSICNFQQLSASSLGSCGEMLRSLQAMAQQADELSQASAAKLQELGQTLHSVQGTSAEVLNLKQEETPSLLSMHVELRSASEGIQSLRSVHSYTDVILSRVAMLVEGMTEDEEWSKWRYIEAERIRSAQEQASTQRAAKRYERRRYRREDAQRAFFQLVCPCKTPYTTICEGDCVARCSGGKGVHAMSIKELADLVVTQGFSRDRFQKFVHDEKLNWLRQDVNKLVLAYMDTDLPADPAVDDEMDDLGTQLETQRHNDHDKRLQEMTSRMQALKLLQDDLRNLAATRRPLGPALASGPPLGSEASAVKPCASEALSQTLMTLMEKSSIGAHLRQ